jgi:methyl-accepting chemotaxis protein
MNRTPRSVTNSLKGRIWLAAIALAVVNGICGLGAYLTLSFFSADPTVTILATFFILTFVTLVFGWWLSSDLLKPIEEVTLLARSLERSPSASLPRTTGAIETDQLLQTLHRNGQQLRNLISLMDDVAAGKVEAASMPLESSDKLSASFQKLVSKVTDSISAKNDLDEIRAAVAALSKEVGGVRNGNLDLNLRSEHTHTREIADAIRFLTTRLSNVTQQIYATTSECERTAAEARSSLQSTLEAIDERSSVLARLGSATPASAAKWDALLSELSRTIQSASTAYDRHAEEGMSSTRTSDAAVQLRNGVAETNKLIQKLRSRTAMVSQSARLAQEIAKRSNLIALNATIASNGMTTTELLASEIEALSGKSDELQKQIVSAGEALNSEIAGIEKELAAVAELAPDLGKALNSSVQVNHTLCEQIAKIGELEEHIRTAAEESRLENDRLTGIIEKVSDVSLASAMVRETETGVQRFSGLLDSLRDSVADLKLTSTAPLRMPELPVRPEPMVTRPAVNGFETMTGFEASTPAEPRSGFETATGFETRTGFDTLIDIDVRRAES